MTRRLPIAVLSALLIAGCGSSSKKHTTTTSTTTTSTNKSSGAQVQSTPGAQGTLAPAPAPAAGGGATAIAPASSIGAGTQTPAANGSGATTVEPTVSASRFFNSASPWNTDISGAPIDPASAALLARAQMRLGTLELARGVIQQPRVVRDGLFINTNRWTTPVVTDAGGVGTKVFCRQIRCGPDSLRFNSLQVPAGANPDPRYDGWFTVIDRGQQLAYDLWRARRQADGSISYQYAKIWALSGYGYSRPYEVDSANAVSARGSGLPLFAGLITPEELKTGVIQHALAISVPGPATRAYVQPASVTDGNGATNSLPEGARIRLRADVALRFVQRGESRKSAQGILTALKRYGAIVVDRAAVPTLYAQKDVTARLLVGNELQRVRLGDFEVVQLPRIYQDPPLAQASQVGVGVIDQQPSAGQAGGQ